MAASAASRTCAVNSVSPAPPIPPVSQTVNGRRPRDESGGEPVAGDSWLIMDDRDIPADQPIKERGFSDVRPPDDGDGADAFFGRFSIP